MSRRALSQKQASITLFPFLAVLICTMGSLIVLLVVVVQRARQQATVTHGSEAVAPEVPPPSAPPAAPPPPDLAAELATQLEDLQWGNQVLAQSRQHTLQRLEEQRLELSRHEDRTRQLAAQLKLLEQQAENLLAAERHEERSTQGTPLELTELQRQLDAARQELATAQEAAEKQRRQYALLPYEGPHGTRRRPIYIECLPNHVLLQPEGVRLGADDFRDSGPHNPLAAALRATREYLLDAGLVEATGEPYPLLVVRPGGARAFSACRNAMRSWDDEYGYELVPDDIELAYPPADPALTALLTETINRARAAMGPLDELGTYFGDQSATYEVGDQSGSGLIPIENDDRSGRGGGLAGLRGTSEGRGFGLGDAAPDATGLAQRGPYRAGGGDDTTSRDLRGTSDHAGTGPTGTRRRYAAAVGGADAALHGVPGSGGTSGPNTTHSGSSRPPLDSSDYRRDSAYPGEPRQPGVAGSAPSPQDGPAGPGDSGNPAAESTDNFSTAGSSSWGGKDGTGSAERGSSAGSGGQGPSTGPAGAGGSSLMASSPQAATSIAQTQGDNWALPHAADGAIGITRPISVTCSRNGIVLMPESGTARTPQRIAFEASIREAIQPLVTSVWDVIDSWGIAGPGVYWKPVLQIRVEPGAEGPFTEMAQLLEDSGLEVQRR